MTDSLKDNSKTLRPVTKFIRLYDRQNPFKFENGKLLKEVDVAYQSYGNLNSDGANAILICHALTGNSHAAGIVNDDEIRLSENSGLLFTYNKMFVNKPGWWDNLIGPGKTFDTNKYFVICSNILGSCMGSTGPCTINPKTILPYGLDFPVVTIGDMVTAQKALLDHLGIEKLLAVVGGSIGGMQLLEWCLRYPDIVTAAIPLATTTRHSALAIAFNEVGRQAIMADPKWNNGNYYF